MNTSDTTENVYPESVYRFVDTEPELDSEGRELPMFTREIAEAVAATKPAWAKFEDSDIEMGLMDSNEEGEFTATWSHSFGKRVDVSQDAVYKIADGEKVKVEPARLQFWGPERTGFTDPVEVAEVAASLGRANVLLAELHGPKGHSPDVIAEEMHDLGLTWLVDYDEHGKPEGVKYERLVLAVAHLGIRQGHRGIED